MCQASSCGYFTCRGPVWRYADPVQITYDALKLALWLPLVFLIPI